jgi:hypothetical protein
MIMIFYSAILDLQITGRHGKASGYIFVTFHMNDEEFTAFIMKCQLLTKQTKQSCRRDVVASRISN